jgi:ADP-ribose pyrophosphatase YjhB (NUDIX family)
MFKNYFSKIFKNSAYNFSTYTLPNKIKEFATINIYKGIELDFSKVIDNASHATELSELDKNFDIVLNEWERNGIRSITITIPDYLCSTLSSFTKRGFYFHHCNPGNTLVLCKWLDKLSPNKLPNYAHHVVGVGACIITKNLEFLLIKEKYSPYSKIPPWKFVTGLIEPGELIRDATLREVREEVNLDVKYLGTILISELFPNIQKVSDLCFFSLCYLEDSSSIKLDDAEVATFKFFKADELREIVKAREATIATINTLNKILDKISSMSEYNEAKIIKECNLLSLKNETNFPKAFQHYNFLV